MAMKNKRRVNVGKIRTRLGLSQSKFAERYGLSVRTVQGWETRWELDQATWLLIRLIERHPEEIAKWIAEVN
ncbi:MAG: helix-turn-helix domain-containing protein [Gammaproteobacteria bacterium]